MKSTAQLEREIQKTRHYLTRLEARYLRMQANGRYKERERIEQAKRQLLRRFPDMTFSEEDERLLRLVGTLPYVPVSRERQELVRAIAASYP
jgi:hypothetical protein